MNDRDKLRLFNIPPNNKSIDNEIIKIKSNKSISKLIIELPHSNITTSGGVKETIALFSKLPIEIVLRFQKIGEEYPQLPYKWTVGLPDNTFPKCDACITFSDTPYLTELVKLPQVGDIYINMLSYGMSINRESKNIHNSNVTTLCSTKKIEKLMLDEKIAPYRIGFILNMEEMFLDKKIKRNNYLAILYNSSDKKRYNLAVSIADYLYDNKYIDGVLSFGGNIDYNKFNHPKGLVEHHVNANRDTIRKIFNQCKCFFMPSISEGLNLTPIESTLCGCPAVICDGAIDEIFFNEKNCIIVNNNDDVEMKRNIINIITNFNKYSNKFRNEMKHIVNQHGNNDIIKNIVELLNIKLDN